LYPSFNFPAMDLVLFGRNKDKMVAMDYRGRTVLYDDALRAVSALPSMKEFEYYHWRCPLSISLPVGDDLFVMNNVPSCYSSGTSVGALINHHGHRSAEAPHMFWHSIRPPPYVKPEYDPDASHCDDAAEAYTVVGDSRVWVSAESYGTYSLDMKNFRYGQEESDETRRVQWRKVGDWVLPFSGPAVYAPELNLWFGFSKEKDDTDTSSNRVICAADLQQAGAAKPPIVSHEWDFTVPIDHEKYYLDGSSLVHLGTGGRFCVASLSSGVRPFSTAMLTGVEVTRCGEGEALRFIQHKTYRYGGLGEGKWYASVM
jgi:hypothetical protein